MKRKNLFPLNKIDYIKDHEYRKKNCILCKVLEGSNEVPNLLIHKGEFASVTLNLYPYNPGHLMVFPNRHVTDLRELKEEEEKEMSSFLKSAITMLQEVYDAPGFNIGYNMGNYSGASIAHLHQHIVPRYPYELSFIDVLSDAKLIVEDPMQTSLKLKACFKKYIK